MTPSDLTVSLFLLFLCVKETDDAKIKGCQEISIFARTGPRWWLSQDTTATSFRTQLRIYVLNVQVGHRGKP